MVVVGCSDSEGSAPTTVVDGRVSTVVTDAGTTGSPSTTGTGTGGRYQTDTPSTSGPDVTTTDTGVWERVDLGFVSAYVLVRAGAATIVDTGVSGSEGAIEEVLAELGSEWADVSTIIVTHAHPDHAGSLLAITEASPAATVHAGAEDIPAMQSTTPVTAAEDGSTVNGLTVIKTPGHTPGHIVIFDPVAGWLLAGDALSGTGGGVAGPNPEFTPDMDTALESVRKLAGMNFDVAVFGHGEPVMSGASASLDNLIASL